MRRRPNPKPDRPGAKGPPGARSGRSVAALELENSYLAALHDISLGLLNRRDRDSLPAAIVRHAADLADTGHGFIHLFDAEGEKLAFQLGTGRFDSPAWFFLKPGQGEAGRALRSGSAITVEDYGPGRPAGAPLFEGLCDSVVVPLADGAGAIGLGYFDDDARRFGPEMTDALRRFARMASIALDNADICVQLKAELDVRKDVQMALERRIRLERIIGDFSFQLIQAATTVPDDTLERGLARIGSFSGADRAYLFLFSEDLSAMTNTHEWCAPGIDPKIEMLRDLPTKLFSWWVEKLKRGEAIHIEDIDGMPPEAGTEKKILARQSIRSVLVVPVLGKNRLEGFIGFEAVRRPLAWSGEDIRLLETAAHIYASALSRNRTEAELRRSEIRYRTLFESTSDLVYTQDLRGCLTSFNPAMKAVFGYTDAELLGRPASDFMPEKFRSVFRSDYLDRIGKEGGGSGVASYFSRDGRRVYIDYRSTLVRPETGDAYISGIGRDVTEKIVAERKIRKLQQEMMQAQKMEAIGTLAGGVAHDFNNLLMGIQGRVSLMLAAGDPVRSDRKHLEKIEECVQSAADLTGQLLGFARGGKYEVGAADMNRLVEKGLEMFGRTHKEIEIDLDLDRDLWPVRVDAGQIEQVLMNFYVNARQSMPGGGTLSIRSENRSAGSEGPGSGDLAPGDYVAVSVADTGVGIDEATRRRIFEPFFTTRKMGRGTGLGLASAYGIVKNHGGTIRVDSRMGAGTTFTLLLPAGRPAATPPGTAAATAPGAGTILLVDDEELVLDVGRQMIRALGYDVVPAAGGHEAVAKFASGQRRFDLVILDMIMPKMSGEETFDRLKAIDPDVRVILSSGYSIDGRASEILRRGCKGFLQKPFGMKDLACKIQEGLGAVSPAGRG